MLVILLIAVTACAQDPQTTIEITKDEAKALTKQHILNSYNYNAHNGHGLYLKEITEPKKEKCLIDFRDYMGEKVYYKSCYKLTFEYFVDSDQLPDSVGSIEISALVLGTDVKDIHYKEVTRPVPIGCKPENNIEYANQENLTEKLKQEYDNLQKRHNPKIERLKQDIDEKNEQISQLQDRIGLLEKANRNEKIQEIEKQIAGLRNQIIMLKENITDIRETTGLSVAEKKYKEAQLSLTKLKWKLCTKVKTFEECVDAGYEVLMPDCKDCPRQCITPENISFFEDQEKNQKICVDKCGDGICQEIVCQGEGCPCAENKITCEEDC